MQQLVFPLALLRIKKECTRDGAFYLTGIVDVNAGLPGECLWDNRCLATAVILEVIAFVVIPSIDLSSLIKTDTK